MNRLEALKYILDNSYCLQQYSYDKKTKVSVELRCKDGKNFILINRKNGENGWDIYTNSPTKSIADAVEQFDNL